MLNSTIHMEENLKQYGFYIERTAKRMKQHLQRKFNSLNYGITVDQWVILDVLHDDDGMSQYEIADRTYKDAPTVTRIIDLLCKKGLTKREIDESDRRRFNIFLTTQGREKVNEILPVVMEFRNQGLRGLCNEDYQRLMRVLDTIFDNFQ